MFSPAEWLQSSGMPRICIGSDDDPAGVFAEHFSIDQLEVHRETRPDSRSLGEHWDTWCGDIKSDMKLPKCYHYLGEPGLDR